MPSPLTTPVRRLALGAAALALALTGCAAPTDSAAPSPSASATTSAAAPTTPPPATQSPSPTRGAGDATSPAASSSPQDPTEHAATGTALAALGDLPVKGRAPKTDYSRDQFGPRWADTDHNGCDTRNDILRRDLAGIAVKPGTHGCNVSSGTLESPYTGETIDFVAGQATSSHVQIDHVVALSDAWQKGAQQLDAARRTELANDPLNLLAVDGPSNNTKSDADAATWLPPRTGERCEYVATQIAVKQRYELWVTDAEKNAMVRVLDTCPEQPLPEARPIPDPADSPVAPVTEAPTAQAPAVEAPSTPEAEAPAPVAPAPAAPGAGAVSDPADAAVPEAEAPGVGVPGADVYFSRCAEARAAGMAPLYAGTPGYRPGLDGDGDGVACESRS
ncbi:GmrSD restriction endonuclease domain-containing protein [Kocuria marina]|uniref:GmrSD restriction endonuclease domain-containing protein n=1 Tax=Kocuria marina TaxID=223184 RepID=UPI0022DFE3D7|nr:DUF1524 domain-containing protein [Kocuria marina]